MLKRLIVLALVAVAMFWLGAISTSTAVPEIPEADSITPTTAVQILDEVNTKRIQAGLKALKLDSRLVGSATYKAHDMLSRNYFGHYDPENQKVMNGVQYAYAATDDDCQTVSENIQEWPETVGTPENVVDGKAGFMKSKSHREAILNPANTLTGISVYDRFVVQHFCKETT